MDFGAFIELQGLRQRYEGLVHVSEISKTRPGSAKEVLKRGQEVWVKVLRITATGGKQQVSLSMRDVDQVRRLAHLQTTHFGDALWTAKSAAGLASLRSMACR
jgi:predicted RNA-binding protein with RPS1 domain